MCTCWKSLFKLALMIKIIISYKSHFLLCDIALLAVQSPVCHPMHARVQSVAFPAQNISTCLKHIAVISSMCIQVLYLSCISGLQNGYNENMETFG